MWVESGCMARQLYRWVVIGALPGRPGHLPCTERHYGPVGGNLLPPVPWSLAGLRS